MEKIEHNVDINKNSSEAKKGGSLNTPSTSRYGRTRKPKSFFKDFYNTEEVVKIPAKRGMKSVSPKSKKNKQFVSEDFVHITGDVDVLPESAVKPLAETTEDNFENFMKSVSGHVDLKPVDSAIKERKFFKSTQESKQASTVSYISKVGPKQDTRTVDSPIERIQLSGEMIEPELDVNKVMKIVTKSTDISQPNDSQKSQKGTIKTYGNKRKSSNKLDVFETFGLPDKPFIEHTETDTFQITKDTKTPDIDVVINTEDKNQISIDTKNSSATTFFGITLSPEKPRDIPNVESSSKVLSSQSKTPSKLITSVTRIDKIQPSSTKIKSVVSNNTAKKIFASVSRQNQIISTKNNSNVQSDSSTSEGQTSKMSNLPKEQELNAPKTIMSVIQSNHELATDIPTCKIKSIVPMNDPRLINNNNQERKFVKVVMDKNKIVKVLPAAGGSVIKSGESGDTTGDSDKSDSIASPPYSPVKQKTISIPSVAVSKVPIPSVITHISSTPKAQLFATSTSATKVMADPNNISPKIIASTRVIRKKYLSPISPVKVIKFPSKDCSLSPVKVTTLTSEEFNVSPVKCNLSSVNLSPIKSVTSSPKLSPTIGRKRKQELVVRKESDHSYSISPPHREVLPIPPKKKFMARMKIEITTLQTSEKDEDGKLALENDKIDETKDPIKDEDVSEKNIIERLPKERHKIVEPEDVKDKNTEKTKIEEPQDVNDNKTDNSNLESLGIITKATKTYNESVKPIDIISFSDLNISPVVRLKQLHLDDTKTVVESRENTPEIINKPLESLSKNVVRVSPRKGKGTNAFLWETNTGAFFMKHSVKSKMLTIPEVQIKEELIDESETKVVEKVQNAREGLIIKKENIEGSFLYESTLSFKDVQHKVVDAAIGKDIVKKIKHSFKDLSKKAKQDVDKEKGEKNASHDALNKARLDTRNIKTNFEPNKIVDSKSKKVKQKKRSANEQSQIGRQLRNRKFIFAEQITSTNRNTTAKLLDNKPIPLKKNITNNSFLGKNKRLVNKISEGKIPETIEIKQEIIEREEDIEAEADAIKELIVEEDPIKQVNIDMAKKISEKPDKISKNTCDITCAVSAKNTEAIQHKETCSIKNATNVKSDKRLVDDVVLIPNRKVIEIDNDNDEDVDKPIAHLVQKQKEGLVDAYFTIKTEVKKEKVTPEKRKVIANIGKRKPVGRPRKRQKHIRRLRMLNDDLQEDAVKENVEKPVIPMPIVSGSDMNNKIDLEIKEEKMDEDEKNTKHEELGEDDMEHVNLKEVMMAMASKKLCSKKGKEDEELLGEDESCMEDVNLKELMTLMDSKKLHTKKGNTASNKYNDGDMVWAKVGCHPYWPAMIARDPNKNSIVQIITSKHDKIPHYHVRYFADNGRRSWVRATALMHYEQKDDLDLLFNSTPARLSKKYKVPKSKLALWRIAIDELESIKNNPLSDKLEFFMKASIRSAKKKKNLSPRIKGIKREKPGLDFDDSPSNVSYKTLSSTRKIPITLLEVQTPTTSRSRMSSVDALNKDSPRSHIDRFLQTQLEDRMSWKKLRSRSVDELESERLKDFDTTDCSSSETDSIHHKILSSGPIPCSPEYQELLYKRNNMFKRVNREKVCEICFKPNTVLSCQGPCNGFYHLDCANGYLDDSSNNISDRLSIKLSTKSYKKSSLSRLRKNRDIKSEQNSGNSSETEWKKCKERKSEKNPINTFICGSCDRNDHCVCFVCSKEVSPNGEHCITKCKVAKCGKAYHRGCTRLWPQVQWLEKPSISSNPDSQIITSVICPRHVCHICVSDDPKAASAKACRSESLVRCLLCPASYHSVTGCIPAGTEIYTYTQVVCPRHLKLPNQSVLSTNTSNTLNSSNITNTSSQLDYYTKPLQTANTNWCFICSEGGNLVCCERCPTSVHEACSPINMMDDDTYVCEDCETGRLILYDEVVWVKLGIYRWWPALVLFPKEIPINVRNLRHRRGEFVIKFFGSYDHHWMGQGRSFLYQEGDKACCAGNPSKRMDIAFSKALREAAKAFELKRDFKKSFLQSDSRQPKSLKPPVYVKIRFNKPVGNVKVYDGNVSITTPCSCDPKANSPCGPNTNCINRLLWTECNPRNCPAGARCQNQLFQTRQYPPLVPYKTDGRGWALKTLMPLAAGQFVIEYVGEVIGEHEYKRRIANMQSQSEMNYYFLTLDTDRVIDAGPKGNVSRFMNHSCEPNCETQKWKVNGDTRIGLFTCEDIPANKELTFNYNLAPNGKALLECKCKAPSCSGFIGVKKAVDNLKAKVVPDKLILKKNQRLTKSSKLKYNNLQQRTCFICGKDGRLITCSIFPCSETYHIECVKLMNVPYAFWRCPRHFCSLCNERIVQRCKLCINSYCLKHCTNRTEGRIIEFICADHKTDSSQINEESNITEDIVTEKISKVVDQSKEDECPAMLIIPKPENIEDDKKNLVSKKKSKGRPLKSKKVSSRKTDSKKRKIQLQIKLTSKREKTKRSR